MAANTEEIQSKLTEILRQHLPDIVITVEDSGANSERPLITLIDPSFEGLYPEQRFRVILHALPKEFLNQHLENAEWRELAPGEDLSSIEYPDAGLIEDISPDVLAVVGGSEFYKRLDSAFLTGAKCSGKFVLSKELLRDCAFDESEIDDIFHVFMSKGGFCDCEILYNVADQSELRSRYWKAQSERHATGQY